MRRLLTALIYHQGDIILMTDEFSLYVAVDADIQTAAEITDVMELWHILP